MLLIMTFGVGGEKCEFADGEFGQEVRVLQWCQKNQWPACRINGRCGFLQERAEGGCGELVLADGSGERFGVGVDLHRPF